MIKQAKKQAKQLYDRAYKFINQKKIAEKKAHKQKLIAILEIITTLLTLVGIGLAVIIIIVSGIRYMGAGGDEAKIAQAKKTLTYGVIGFIVVVAAMFIICFIAEILANLYAV